MCSHGNMRALTIADSANIILGLQDEIRRSEESRYDHRLHGVLLVAQGMTCPEVAALLGDAPRSVEYWVGSFEKSGLAGLREGERSGRPGRLDEKQLRGINAALRKTPRDMGLGGTLWDGKTLAAWIAEEYEITWEYVSASVCSGSWAFGCASHAPVLPKPIQNGK